MQPKYVMLVQCTFGETGWEPIDTSYLFNQKNLVMKDMIKYRSVADGVKVNLLDMNMKLIKMSFKTGSAVGVGNGMFYCDSEEVKDTKIEDAPAEYINSPTPGISE